MKKRSLGKKLLLSKETIRSLIPDEFGVVVRGGVIQCRKISYGVASACDCQGGGSDTCMECSTMQY